MNNSKIKNVKKTSALYIRMCKEEKEALKEIASMRKMNISEYVLSMVLRGTGTGAMGIDKNIFELMNNIIRELNGIGKNINQATHAINILKNNLKMPEDEYHQFNEHVRTLLETENRLSYQMEKIIKDGSLSI